MGLAPPGQAAQGHPARVPRGLRAVGHRQEGSVLRAVQPRPEGQDPAHRLPAPGRQGVAAGPGHGDPVQGGPAGEHGRRAPGQGAALRQPRALRAAAPHRRGRQGARPLPGLFRARARLWTIRQLKPPGRRRHQTTAQRAPDLPGLFRDIGRLERDGAGEGVPDPGGHGLGSKLLAGRSGDPGRLLQHQPRGAGPAAAGTPPDRRPQAPQGPGRGRHGGTRGRRFLPSAGTVPGPREQPGLGGRRGHRPRAEEVGEAGFLQRPGGARGRPPRGLRTPPAARAGWSAPRTRSARPRPCPPPPCRPRTPRRRLSDPPPAAVLVPLTPPNEEKPLEKGEKRQKKTPTDPKPADPPRPPRPHRPTPGGPRPRDVDEAPASLMCPRPHPAAPLRGTQASGGTRV
ncbi:nuclear factor 1 X-type isoform X3 [Patagioenas fasciata]|uniref:nuclear factor 1 X-type isoform X3 n=1 Tax=Patagioenas fasciata TaxID=372321 RepID=UPI003A99FD00